MLYGHNALKGISASLLASALIYTVSANSVIVSEDVKLTAFDGFAGEQFGAACAAHGETLVVGSYRDRDNGISAGGVYVYERQADGSWGGMTNLLASDGSDDDIFGLFIDIEDDTMMIGAVGDSDDRGRGTGSVYVFNRGSTNQWAESMKLIASDGQESDNFGGSLALSGGTLFAGAALDDDNGENSGSVYVFELDGAGRWFEAAKLHPSDGAAHDNFGLFMASTPTTAVIGAPNSEGVGAAYVFERRNNGSWRQRAKLVGDDAPAGANFGGAVAISGDTIMVGAPGDDDLGSASGSTYVFERGSNGRWHQSAKLRADDGHANAFFGRALDLNGDMMVVGAPGDDDNGPNSGSAYLFKRDGAGIWRETTKLVATDGRAGDMFAAFAPALTDGWLVIGSRFADDNGENSGSAYVYDLDRAENIADIASPEGGVGVPDGIVDGDDLLVLFSNWGGCPDDCAPGTCSGDLNGDCLVDGADLEMMLGRWSVEE